MSAYFLGLSEEEKNTIKDKHRKPYDGYVTRGFNEPKEQILNVENLALDEKGITVNNEGDVTEYKNTNINQKMKKVCEQCSGLYEGEMCECGKGGMYEGETCEQCGEMKEGETCECGTRYSMEEIEEGIKVKSKASLVQEQINESLKWFKKIL
jgi:hypothetical protein